MRINSLHVKNFRNISDTTLDLQGVKFAVLRGSNRNGKTSIAEAISLALTPTTKGLAANGAGFARKVKRGETKASIEIDLQGANRTIRRNVNLSVTASGKTQHSQDPNDPSWNSIKFDSLIDSKKTAMGIAINTQQFQSMIYSGDEKAQKNLLAQLVLPARYEFPKETIADVDAMLGEGTINFNGEPFAVIETAYKKLYKEREDVNRTVKAFTIPAPLPRPQGVDSASLKSQLAALREARSKWSAERDEASKKASEAAVKQARAKAKVETLEASLKATKDSLRAFNEAILPDPAEVLLVAGRREKRDQLVSQSNKLQDEINAAKRETARIIKVSEIGSECPTCGQEIEEFKIVQMAQKSTADCDNYSAEYDRVQQSIKDLGDVDWAIEKLARHKEAIDGKADIVARIESQTKELEGARAEANIGGLFNSSVFDKTLEDTGKKIETILEQIQPVIAAEEREKDIVTKNEQFKKLEDKAAKLDTLVAYFDKNGIKANLIANHIGGFEEKCNEVLKVWDYSCSLSIEPFRFEVTDYRKVSTALIDLSGAEELMFYAAFQCAVSRTTGIGFAVIDRVDTLLPDLRPKLYQHLYKMTSDKLLDQVILLVADTSEQVPKLDNSAFFVVEEGSIRRLG